MLTIVIPIYKVECYIEKCVRSLMEQTLIDDVEFLFVNDCTPDRSMDILSRVLQDYPYRLSQVTIVENEENMGISNTRKKALSIAKGDYIGWCDSDDWCEPLMFEKLMGATANFEYDVVVSNYFIEDEMGEITEAVHESTEDPKEALAQLMQKFMFPFQLWETIMRKELLIEGFARIKPTMSGEDCYAAMIALYYAKNIFYVDECLYHHIVLSTSLTRNVVKTRNEWNAQKYNIEYVENLYDDEKYSDGLLRWKVFRKTVYISVFSSLWDFYRNFPETEWSKPRRYNFPLVKRIIAYPMYHIFPLYWMMKDNIWKRNRLDICY